MDYALLGASATLGALTWATAPLAVRAIVRSRRAITSPLAVTRLQKRRPDWDTYIRTYEFPAHMLDRALARCPVGTSRDQVEQGLRQFFLACGSLNDLAAAMPSTTVDEAWHEFLTYTRDYAAFCEEAFATMLHHVPDATMSTSERATNQHHGIVMAWVVACREADLNPFGTQAPTLFASDAHAHSGGRGWHRLAGPAHRYTGFCGPDPALAGITVSCQARAGTICMRHAYAPTWRDLARILQEPHQDLYDPAVLAWLAPALTPPASRPQHRPQPPVETGSLRPDSDLAATA